VGEADFIAFAREAFEACGDEAGDGGGVGGFDFGAEGVHPVGDGEVAGDEVDIVAEALDRTGGGVVGFVDVADHLFDDIFEGDEADDAAELIDDDGELGFSLAEVEKEAVEGLLFGDVADGLDEFADVEAFAVAGVELLEEDGFGVDEAEDVVDLAVEDGDFGEVGLAEEGDEGVGGILDVEGDDIDARGHDITNFEVGDAEDFLEELVFGDVDDALFFGHFEEFVEFLGGEGGFVAAGADEAVEGAHDGDVDELADGPEDADEGGDGEGDEGGDAGVVEGADDFGEDVGDVGDHEGGDDDESADEDAAPPVGVVAGGEVFGEAGEEEGGDDEDDDVAGHVAHEETGEEGAGIVEESGGEDFEAVFGFFHAGAFVAGEGKEDSLGAGEEAGDSEEDQEEENEEDVLENKSHAGDCREDGGNYECRILNAEKAKMRYEGGRLERIAVGGGFVRTVFRPLVIGGAVLALAGCGGSAARPASSGQSAVVRNPAELLAILASGTTPTDSRESADRLLVEEKGAREPARLAVLEQIIYAPGHSAEMRIYAMDALAEADPVRAGQVLLLYLPQLQEGGAEWTGVLDHACALCVRLGDDRVIESLIRSMRRVEVEGATAATWRGRPEWGAIEALGGRPGAEVMYRVIAQSRDRSARIAALDIVQTIDGAAATMERVRQMTGEDEWMTDLRWWLGEFETLPVGESESIWMDYLHRPGQEALVARAAKHDRELRAGGAADYVFAPRFVAVLAYADEGAIGMSREGLLRELRRALADVPHQAGRDGREETLAGNEKRLTRGDLLAMRLLLRGLAQRRVIDELLRQGLDDLSDASTAYGGLLTLGKLDAPAMIATLYPPLEGDGDEDYRASDSLIQQMVVGVAEYRFNFQRIRNAERVGPSERDLRFMHALRGDGVVITSVGTRTMDCVYYTGSGAVVDLGVYASK
jgi:hypothetical protein